MSKDGAFLYLVVKTKQKDDESNWFLFGGKIDETLTTFYTIFQNGRFKDVISNSDKRMKNTHTQTQN